ncbi:toll/interleukin-1 receptor domain-containing protein [Actinoplanes sp. NPDC051475]|uniref:toll/interleukin-1 receptor domain-containing protein n=1 Tax=Actinoplanes sp. NPDC051475 TaxID=3157225 RepID=UPI003450366F
MPVFLSHNHLDKDVVRQLAAQLHLAGADVWFDEWRVQPGDQFPTRISEALAAADTVVVIWSANAAASRWVEAELATALAAQLAGGATRIIPVLLDDTDLPAMLRPIACIDGRHDGTVAVARRILGIGSDAEYIKAVQEQIEEAGLEYRYFRGYGVALGCPECGLLARDLEPYSQIDRERDDLYAGVRCPRCGWNDGGEI